MAADEALTMGGQRQPRLVFWVIGVIVAMMVGVALFGAAVYFVADDEDMPVVLTSDNSGTTYRMDIDEVIVVSLDSNATTGYEWAIDELDETVVTSLGSTYIAPANGAVGQGGIEEWTFEALDSGITTLSLKYWRPWEGDASIVDRFELMLEVRD
jgi:inhibitor of cysteine peptidase